MKRPARQRACRRENRLARAAADLASKLLARDPRSEAGRLLEAMASVIKRKRRPRFRLRPWPAKPAPQAVAAALLDQIERGLEPTNALRLHAEADPAVEREVLLDRFAQFCRRNAGVYDSTTELVKAAARRFGIHERTAWNFWVARPTAGRAGHAQ